MVDDEVRIRPVQPEEAEELSVLAWRSKESWDYPMEVINELREHFLLTHEYFENNPAYLMENEETGEILGFYSLERKDDGWWLRHLWVAPEHIGMGTGSALFLDACEIAETMGAEDLYILCDPHAEPFYVRMGAARVGEQVILSGALERIMPVLKIKL